MKFERAFMRSRVARRIIVLFVLSAVVPVLAMGALAFEHLRGLLIEQSYVQLAQLSESYGTGVYERLLIADNQARALFGIRAGRAEWPREVQERLRRQFRAIGIVEPGTPQVDLLGTIPALPPDLPGMAAHLASGESVLARSADSDETARLFLVRSLKQGRGDARRLVLELDPGYLWGEPEAVPAYTDFCVVDDDGRLLQCTQSHVAAQVASAMKDHQSATGRFRFDEEGTAYLANYRDVFLAPRFLARGWTVVAARPEAQALATISSFVMVLVPVMVLALLIVAFLSVNQIRRTLVPLEKLIDGTRRAGNKDFSVRVDIPSTDEFGELADSFNSMAARLGSQFSVLMTLSEIDRAILSRLDVDRVLETVVMRMNEIVPCDYVSIGLLDRHAGSMLCMYTRDQRSGGALRIERATCSEEVVAELLAHRDGRWIDPTGPAAPYTEPIRRLGAAPLFVLPIVWHEAVVGMVLLGFSGEAALSSEERAQAQNLGDRVGVAFATAAKDEQLYTQAHYDSLTNLPNRLYFKDQLARHIVQSQRDRKRFALLFIDLDHFKRVNDSLGHAAGDDVLRQAADRLRACIRETDTIARLGGDEFTVILSEIKTARDADLVAKHVIKAMKRPFSLANQEHFLNASIGIAIYPADGTTVDELLRNADTAMYKAKEAGRGMAVYFEDRMNQAAQARVVFESDMRHAIARNEFVLYYQPQLALGSGTVSGAEALVRWRHPERGLLAPNHFIQLAEETGLIDALGERVLREACRQFVAWQDTGLCLPRVAVNVSPRQFRQKDFPGLVARVLAQTGMPASCLELEITETVLLDSSRHIEAALGKLVRLGVRIALDDFGTGYSSLAYLKRFPVDIVKIDRSFVKDLPTEESSCAIAAAVIAMAHALHKEVIAEGVSSDEQVQFLRRLRCDVIQGFHFSRPIEAADFAALMRREMAVGVPVSETCVA